MQIDKSEIGAGVQKCVDHAVSEFDDGCLPVFSAWPQRWPNSGKGHNKPGNMVLQAFHDAMTVMVSGMASEERIHFIYHDYRLAYAVQDPTDDFDRDVQEGTLQPAHGKDGDVHDLDVYGTVTGG